MAAATAAMGLMAAFALVLVPAWLAFRLAPGWRWALALAAACGVLGYLVAFAVALVLDQPFAPVLVAVLLATASAGGALEQGIRARLEPHRPPPAARPSPIEDTGDRTA
jgi:zinc transport system permease protein